VLEVVQHKRGTYKGCVKEQSFPFQGYKVRIGSNVVHQSQSILDSNGYLCWACLASTQYTVPVSIPTLKSIAHDAFNGMAWLLVFEFSQVSQEGLTILTCLLLLLTVFG
jgi:hypothetical protein